MLASMRSSRKRLSMSLTPMQAGNVRRPFNFAGERRTHTFKMSLPNNFLVYGGCKSVKVRAGGLNGFGRLVGIFCGTFWGTVTESKLRSAERSMKAERHPNPNRLIQNQ